VSIDTFIAQRQARWTELESAIVAARHGVRSLPAAGLERFGVLLRHASSDLAIARRDYPDAAITEYLNSLVSRAHPLLYRGAAIRLGALPEFFAVGLPRTFRAAWPYFLTALGLMLLGFIAGWVAVDLRPDLRSSLVPQSLFDQMARGQVHDIPDAPFGASFIILNNVRVAVICFATGVLFGVIPALVLLSNGWIIGAIAAAVHQGGYDLQFWSLIAPHGVLELSIIVIAGGTGLMLGDAVLRPGQLRRGDALSAVGPPAARLAVGAATLLVIAGTLEAFVSPSDLPEAAKLAIGAASGALLYSWLLLSGR
jgi:uncharacterized membrane protein SpoIIM required for sporulation